MHWYNAKIKWKNPHYYSWIRSRHRTCITVYMMHVLHSQIACCNISKVVRSGQTAFLLFTCQNRNLRNIRSLHAFAWFCGDRDTVIHVLIFLRWEFDHSMLCRISRKVFAQNLRLVKQISALTLSLLCSRMCNHQKLPGIHPGHGVYRDFGTIKHVLGLVVFLSDHNLLRRIFRKSFAKKSGTNQKKFCSETLTHV